MKAKSRESVEVWLDADFLSDCMKIGLLSHDRGQYYFDYDKSWLASAFRFSIDPDLALFEKEQHAPHSKFKIFMDSAPDRWGRVLMDKREVTEAVEENRGVRALTDWDYLLGVQDATRMGALRLKNENGDFIDQSNLPAPPVTSLKELQSIAKQLESSEAANLPELRRWLSAMLAPGTSLGGARPKANFINADGSLWIAKFPSANDKHNIGLWELITHELANNAGITVPKAYAEVISGDHHTFCVERFDRIGKKRKMFVSAMTMLEKNDGESASYIEIADFIKNSGAKGLKSDLEQLWRRMMFNVMVSNRDDHLRNHGFIRGAEGWKLSPAYDMNPTPSKAGHSLNLDLDSSEPSVETLFNIIEWFDIAYERAVEITEEVRSALLKWEFLAEKYGLGRTSILSMSPAFSLVSSEIPPKSMPRKKNKL